MRNVFVSTLLYTTVFVSQISFASNISEKVVEKARYAVEQAAPDDWYTLAKSAEKCIRKGVNLKEAAAWLNQSIRIKRTPYNLEVQGDYFASNQLPIKAIRAYAESHRIALLVNPKDKDREVCLKIRQQVTKSGGLFKGELEATLPGEPFTTQVGTLLHKIVNEVW